MFDPLEPPTDYKGFKKEILKTVDEAEIELDEGWDTALFLTNREGEGELIYIEDIIDDMQEEHPDLNIQDLIENHLPDVIKQFNSKFFAFVFPGWEVTPEDANDDGPELMCILMGGLFEMHLLTSEVDRENDVYAHLGPWEAQDPNIYPNLTLPFRKAITYQSD